MARLLVLVAIATTVATAEACAFPKQGCMASVCSALRLQNFDDLLNEAGTLPRSLTFNETDDTNKGDWASRALRNTLGHFFYIYNPIYNNGEYDKSLMAVRDKAPHLNYFRFRNSFGSIFEDGRGTTLSECCNLCRMTNGCQLYQFNPYTEDIEDASGNVIGQRFLSDGTGDCYNVDESSNLLPTINGLCNNKGSADFYDTTVKATFFGGLCNVDVDDDPHFVGARGTRFDFNGQLDRSFCLISDERLQVNTLLRGYQDPRGGETGLRSWMKELGFVWSNSDGQRHTLQLVARAGKEQPRGSGFLSQVLLDGSALGVPSAVGQSVTGVEMELVYLGMRTRGPYEIDEFSLKISDLLDLGISMRVAHPLLQTPEDAEVHFNMNLKKLKTTENIHGLLGQTYKKTPEQQLKAVKYSILSRILGAPVQADGKTGKGFLEGEVSDYITSSVVSPDCKFSKMTM